jgi:hypothetical protein
MAHPVAKLRHVEATTEPAVVFTTVVRNTWSLSDHSPAAGQPRAALHVGVYIDGYNLYYGGCGMCGRGVAGWRWTCANSQPRSSVHSRTGRVSSPSGYLASGKSSNSEDSQFWRSFAHDFGQEPMAIGTPPRGDRVLIRAWQDHPAGEDSVRSVIGVLNHSVGVGLLSTERQSADREPGRAERHDRAGLEVGSDGRQVGDEQLKMGVRSQLGDLP